MRKVIACLITLSAVGALSGQQTPIDYRFDEVKRKVVLTTSKQELRVDRGQRAHGGDRVQTGLFSYALIASERHQARFEMFSSTSIQLAEGTPGVILSVERGKLHAIFDKIVGNEPRVVKTPGALLAVRGTQYVVEVDDAGRTTLDVFEGTVEVRSPLREQPLLVHAGQESIFGRSEPPTSRPMPDDRRRNDPNRRGDEWHGGPGDHRGQAPHGGGPEGQPPQPTSPPPKPGGHH